MITEWASAAVTLVVLFATGTSQSGTPERVVGFVRDVQGTWQLTTSDNATLPVSRGQIVSAKGTLTAIDGERPRIVIARAYGADLSSCSKNAAGEECVKELSLPDVPAPTPFVQRLWEAVGRFFSAPEGTFIVGLSRGGSLRDGIVPVNGETLELAHVVRLQAGTYQAELAPVDRAAANVGVRPLVVTQTPSTSRAAAPAGVITGLYTLTLVDTGESAWVLVGPAKQVARALEAFDELDRATAEWSIDASERRGIRRALLQQYAQSIAMDSRK
jgi:hypothetical protein